jgi:hypothetical protein
VPERELTGQQRANIESYRVVGVPVEAGLSIHAITVARPMARSADLDVHVVVMSRKPPYALDLGIVEEDALDRGVGQEGLD